MTNFLSLKLLGAPEVRLNDGQPVNFISRKAEATLYYLAVTCQTHARAHLAALFWPEDDEKISRKNMRDVVFHLKKAVGSHLLITRMTLAFNTDAPHELDTTLLQTAVSPTPNLQTLPRAIAAYRSDFLTGFHVNDAPEFENWVVTQTAYWRSLFIQGLALLAAHYVQQRQYAEGLAVTARLLEAEPWSERTYRQRMLLFAYNQQRSNALKTYRQCQQALDEAFGIPPAAETVALYNRIRAEETDGGKTAVPLHNLPREFTPFIGRQSELQTLRKRVLDPLYPLVTIMGEGGVGKSRLAMTAAAQLLYDFPDGVWFVPLLGIEAADKTAENETALALAIGKALQLQLQSKIPITEQVIAHARQKQLLLVLDNMERLVSGVDFIVRLLREARKTQLIVTSRLRLNLQMESVFRLRGLPAPDKDAAVNDPVAYANAYASVQLFSERARRAAPNFGVSAENMGAIGDICRLVDGLPLGIELAAALVEQQACADIAAHIKRGIEALAVTMRDLPVHHRTIWALFAYSWQLLSENNRLLLARCSLFAGSFTLEAATAVTDAGENELTELIDHSLLTRGQNGRYAMHPLIQQFAAQKLDEIGGTDDGKKRHSAYYLTNIARQTDALIKGIKPKALHKLTAAMNNIRQAWETAVSQHNYTLLANAAIGIGYLFRTIGLPAEGISLMRHALAQIDNDSALSDAAQRAQAGLLAQCASLLNLTGQLSEAYEMAQQAGAYTQDANIQAYALSSQVVSQTMSGVDSQQVDNLISETLLLTKRQQLPNLTALILQCRGICAYRTGSRQKTLTYFKEATAICYKHDLSMLLVESLIDLGTFYHFQGRYAAARQLFEESRLIQQQLQNYEQRAYVLSCLTRTTLKSGDFTAAQTYHQELTRLTHTLNTEDVVSNKMFLEMLIQLQMENFAEAYHAGKKIFALVQETDNPYFLSELYLLFGHTQRGMGRYAEAKSTYEKSLNICREQELVEGTLEPLAALALLACREKNNAQAQALIDEVTAKMAVVFLQHEAIIDLMGLYWTCYQVLAQLNDSRAEEMLQTAYNLLQEQAALIEETAVRQQFLQNIPAHRKIMQLMEKG